MNINDLDRLIALQEIGKPNSVSTDLQNNMDNTQEVFILTNGSDLDRTGFGLESMNPQFNPMNPFDPKHSEQVFLFSNLKKEQPMQWNQSMNPPEIDISFTTTMDSTMYIKKIWFSYLLECFQNILLASIQFGNGNQDESIRSHTLGKGKQWFPNPREYYVEKMKHVVEMKPILAKRYQFQKAEFLQYAKTTHQPFLVGMSDSIVQLFEQRFESCEKILQMEQKGESVMIQKDCDACETLKRSLHISTVEYQSQVEHVTHASALLEKEIVQSFSEKLDRATRECKKVSNVAKEMMSKYGSYIEPFVTMDNESNQELKSIQTVAKKIKDAFLFLGQAQPESCSIQYVYGLESAIQEMQQYILEYGLQVGDMEYESTNNEKEQVKKSLMGRGMDSLVDSDELENVSNQRKRGFGRGVEPESAKESKESMVFSTSVLEKIAAAAAPGQTNTENTEKEPSPMLVNKNKPKTMPTPSIKACTQKIETIESQIKETQNLLEMAQREYQMIHEKMKRISHSNLDIDSSNMIQDVLRAAQQSKDQITKIDQVLTTLTCSLEMARMEYEKVKMIHHAQAHGTWIQQLKELVSIGKQVQLEYEKVVTELEKEKFSLQETRNQRIEKIKQQTIQTMRLATRTMLDQRIMEWKQVNAQLFGPLMTKLQYEQQDYSRQMARLQTSIYMDHPMMGTKLADLGNAADALLQANEECILIERIIFVMQCMADM